MRQQIDRLIKQFVTIRGNGRQLILTRRDIKQLIRAQHPECVGVHEAHADLAANSRAIRNLGRKALATILRA